MTAALPPNEPAPDPGMLSAPEISDALQTGVVPFEARNAPPGTRNILLTLAYDGTAYNGWQVQPDRPSIQARVEQAIRSVTGEARRVYCAGRTDTGVHALGQAANFYTLSRIPERNFRLALQTSLPDDITIVSAREVSLKFHATFSAVRKRYRYILHDRGVCPPFLKRYCAPSRFALDARLMHAAAQELLGRHDFRCFEKEYPNKETSVRTIFDAVVFRTGSWELWNTAALTREGCDGIAAGSADEAPFIVFEVEADGFLYNMVRAIVGTLTEVGRGRRPVHALREVIQSLDRSAAGMTAVPQGLYLVRVEYPSGLLRPQPPK
jgi:tRNA pseudouridine38-40 synthase